ncbi:MAG TPA: hypothetical protein DCE56_16985 [Cyanobacteria bacterium UBA8553]|nr:hypothetical protein [Cyanobacteria bacterium UBA8553]HAJ64584.1 hypothetical protein [Cyanobacteria bacterium UBA8543]
MVICLPHLIFCAFSQALFWTFSAGEHFFYSVFYRTVVAGVPEHVILLFLAQIVPIDYDLFEPVSPLDCFLIKV